MRNQLSRFSDVGPGSTEHLCPLRTMDSASVQCSGGIASMFLSGISKSNRRTPALRCRLQRTYSKLLVIGDLVHTIGEVGFGGASCILREQKSELGSKERRK